MILANSHRQIFLLISLNILFIISMNYLKLHLRPYLLILICFFFSFYKADAQVQTARYTQINGYARGFYEYLPEGYSTSNETYPLIIFFHGAGERGDGSPSQLPLVLRNGIPKLINNGTFPKSFTVNGKTYRFIVISPQILDVPDQSYLDGIIDYAVKNYRVDASRIYMTGLSMGGGLTVMYTGGSATYPKRLAAAAPVCEAYGYSEGFARNIAQAQLPTWFFHNNGDPTVSVNLTLYYVKGINAYNPPVKAKQTIFTANSHDAWTKAYDPAYKENGMNMYEWLLQYQRGTSTTPTPNQVPKVNAGTDVAITLPVNAVQLNGSASDPDGSIQSYSWGKVSGPNLYTITNATIANPVLNLVAGDYIFRLTVKDNLGATSYDEVAIKVNPATVPPPPTYIKIPANIEAESYTTMSGVQKESSTDVSGVYDMGWIDKGDWMDYNINVPSAGNYTMNFRVSSLSTGGQFQVRKSDGTSLATINVASTGGWQNWVTVTATAALAAGNQTLRLYAVSGGWNINWLQFSNATASIPPPTTTGAAKSIKINIYGGGGTAYNNSEWNNWDFSNSAGSKSSSVFKYSDGTSSGVSAVLSQSEIVRDNGATYGGSMAPAEVIRYTSYATTYRTLTISGLSTSKKYSFELYSSRANSPANSTIFLINGVSQTVNSSNNLGQKVIFSNITPDAQGHIAISINKSGTYSYINGLTITEGTTSSTTTMAAAAASTLSATNTSLEVASSFQVYPNPVTDKLNVKITDAYLGEIVVQLMDINGAVKKEFKSNKDQELFLQTYSLDSNITAGVYLLRVVMGKSVNTIKIVKQ